MSNASDGETAIRALLHHPPLNLPVSGPADDHHSTLVEDMARFREAAQSNAIEQLVNLKKELRDAETDAFWVRLMEGITKICGSQCAFVAKRVLSDTPTVEERLLGVALFYNDGHSVREMHRNYKYLPWMTPRRVPGGEKVCLVSGELESFMGDDKDKLPFPMDAYLSVPLVSAGKCFAHLGLMWTAKGLKDCAISWAYIEMILHSLEDLILHRMAADEGQRYAQRREERPRTRQRAATHQAVAPAFQPYARSLSHELRTPMQGVVGMLDVMHATVRETIESGPDSEFLSTFQELRESIEAVQGRFAVSVSVSPKLTTSR